MRISTARSIVSAHPVAWWLLRTVLAYSLLLSVSLWSPAGLHRLAMGRRDWLHWTASYAALAAGALIWISTGRHFVGVVALLAGGAWWFSLLIGDLFTMWTWRWPFSRRIATQFNELNQNFGLLENAGLFVIVALAMRLFVHLS